VAASQALKRPRTAGAGIAGARDAGEPVPCVCVPDAHFSWESLTCKGPRKNPDQGSPVEYTRALCKHQATAVGSWGCTEGVFAGSANRPTTEIFLVVEGAGDVIDLDGTAHAWRAGDVVVLPKGWSGRWDVQRPIRKVWAVVSHEEVLSAEASARAVTMRAEDFAPSRLSPDGPREADWGAAACSSKELWEFGPMEIGAWACTPGGFRVANRPTTEMFVVLEGSGFLTDLDGTARRFGPGSTVVLPKGWSGRWDVLEAVRKLYVVVAEAPGKVGAPEPLPQAERLMGA
jgi:uncharacterized cupin superfamily protein